MQVICIKNPRGWYTLGQPYEVSVYQLIGEEGCTYLLRDDSGQLGISPQAWFLPVKELRASKLKRILL